MTIHVETDALGSLSLDDESIIRQAQSASNSDIDFTSKLLHEFTVSQLVMLITLLLQYIRDILLKKMELPIGMKELQEVLDSWTFQRKKDSTVSGMRPSSDIYRSKEANEKESTETDETSSSQGEDKPTSVDGSHGEDDSTKAASSEQDADAPCSKTEVISLSYHKFCQVFHLDF